MPLRAFRLAPPSWLRPVSPLYHSNSGKQQHRPLPTANVQPRRFPPERCLFSIGYGHLLFSGCGDFRRVTGRTALPTEHLAVHHLSVAITHQLHQSREPRHIGLLFGEGAKARIREDEMGLICRCCQRFVATSFDQSSLCIPYRLGAPHLALAVRALVLLFPVATLYALCCVLSAACGACGLVRYASRSGRIREAICCWRSNTHSTSFLLKSWPQRRRPSRNCVGFPGSVRYLANDGSDSESVHTTSQQAFLVPSSLPPQAFRVNDNTITPRRPRPPHAPPTGLL